MEAHMLALATRAEHKGLASQFDWFHHRSVPNLRKPRYRDSSSNVHASLPILELKFPFFQNGAHGRKRRNPTWRLVLVVIYGL